MAEQQLMQFSDTAIERLKKETEEYYRREGHGFAVRVYSATKNYFIFANFW